jgi:hypothetical protein
VNRSRQLLITDNGPHPPDLWAMATADHLVQLDIGKASVKEMRVAQALENDIADAITKHISQVQEAERSDLAENGDDAVRVHHDPHHYLDEAVADVVRCTHNLKFEKDPESENVARRYERHFGRADVQNLIRQTLREHFSSVMHIEHSWFAGDTPAHKRHRDKYGMKEPGDNARSFRALHHPQPTEG